MRKYLLRRFAFAVVTLFGVTILVFILSRLGPDPLLMFVRGGGYGINEEIKAELREHWGLDRPLVVQYLVWIGNVLQGDLGKSILNSRSVAQTIGETIGATVQLAVIAWIIATGVGVPLGVLVAVKRGSIFDYAGRIFAGIGQATPSFWLALVLILIFAVRLGWLPSASKVTGGTAWDQTSHYILPALVLAFGPWATYLRLTRSAMLEVLDSQYVVLARAKGVSGRAVIWKHALRNSLVQPLTTSALVFASFITGALFVETIFAWPGIGRLAVEATLQNDFPLLAGIVLVFGVFYVTMNFFADIAYMIVDPRIRLD